MERRNGLAKSDGPGDYKLNVFGVPSAEVEKIWRHVEPLIEQALRGSFGQHSIEDIYDELTNRMQYPDGPHMQLWVGMRDSVDLICITTLDIWPSLKTCTVTYMAGSELDSYVEALHNVITEWAKSKDCDKVLALFRPGLKRKLKHRGWIEGQQIMVRELK